MTHPLAPLLTYRQWILVKLVPLPSGKTDKLPLDPRTGQVTAAGSGGAHNPGIWLDYGTAAATAAAWGAGYTVGFVITATDPFWCLDIDNALQADGTWSPLAVSLCQALPGTVVEVSQSGRGLHVWGQGPVPPHAAKNVALGLELYTELRFIAIGTGHTGDMTRPCPAIAAVAAHYFPPRVSSGAEIPETGPRADWRGPPDTDAGNADLLRRAMQSKSAASVFGVGPSATFADLYHADDAALARKYPPDASSSEPFDRSSADAGLFQHLAFWTGCDKGRMRRLAEGSKLKREKWEREDYLARTIDRAAALQQDVLRDAPPAQPPGPALPAATSTPPTLTPGDAPNAPIAPAAAMQTVDTDPWVRNSEQPAYFAGCTYVVDQHRVLCPGGKLLTPDRFKAFYGGRIFTMDRENQKTSRDAFEAFTQNLVNRPPTVDGTAFKPTLPFGAVIESEGRRRVNTYWPANVKRVKGDVGPFLRHLAKLLPQQVDQRILLYYLAGVVQFAGHKFQWFPLLIGAEGNGKTFMAECAARAVGIRYTAMPAMSALGEKFNGWLYGNLLYLFEDLKIGDDLEVWERMKPVVTGGRIAIENKGIDARTDEVCGNIIANSNHLDAIRATLGDRRVCHLHTGQMTPAHVERDGMGFEYMKALHEWANERDGYAIVAEFLHTLVIPPEYGLAWLKGRAPRTSSTGAALRAGLGRLEQEVVEQIEQGAVGFRGGWVSSTYLDRFLAAAMRSGTGLAPNKRRALMEAIGYDWHPALKEGRVHNEVQPDNGKPRLYIRLEHPARAITSPAEVARAYTAAQTGVSTA